MNNTTSPKRAPTSPSIGTALGAVWVSIFALEAFLVAAANALTILTFIVNRHLRKRSFYLIINLACADFLVGSLVIPVFANSLRELIFDSDTITVARTPDGKAESPHFYITVIYSFVSVANGLSLVLISLERMFATIWPLRHRTVGTLMYVIPIAVVWSLSVISVLMMYFAVKFAFVFLTIGAVITSLILCASYVAIFINVKYQHQQQEQTNLQRTAQKEREKKRELELAKTLLIVTVSFCLTWVPVIVNAVRINAGIGSILTDDKQQTSLLCLLALNSLLDPIIYAARMKEFRRALYRLVCNCSRERRVYVHMGPRITARQQRYAVTTL